MFGGGRYYSMAMQENDDVYYWGNCDRLGMKNENKDADGSVRIDLL